MGEHNASCQFIELAVRTMQSDHQLQSSDDVRKLAETYGLKLTTYDPKLFYGHIVRSYLSITQSSFEAFLQDLHRLINAVTVTNIDNRRDGESEIECICRYYNKQQISYVKNDAYICDYYRLVRNSSTHINKRDGQSNIKVAYGKINREVLANDSRTRRLNAPNIPEDLCFDDFVLFSRSCVHLAKELYEGIDFDYEKVIMGLPDSLIKDWKAVKCNEQKLSQKLHMYLSANYHLRVSDWDDSYVKILEGRM